MQGFLISCIRKESLERVKSQRLILATTLESR